jgi:hypothetical protein
VPRIAINLVKLPELLKEKRPRRWLDGVRPALLSSSSAARIASTRIRVHPVDLPIADDVEDSNDASDEPDGGAKAIAGRSHAAAFIAGRRSEVT